MAVFITDLAAFLPNAPIDNEQMEEILGMVNQLPSRTRRIILRNNRINTRFYAIDPATGRTTHNNARLTAEAVRRLRPGDDFSPRDIQCLSCGTSSPDQLMPGHAAMVHGELGGGPCEILSAAGVCASGMSALKYAYMNVALGLTDNAVATGSELASSFMQARMCQPVPSNKVEQLENQPIMAFEADFLRWMLSDGAGAAYLSNAPRADGLSLRIDWIELLSFAHLFEPCMYAGAEKNADGTLTGWREYPSLEQAAAANSFLIKQDVKLLNREVVATAVDRTLRPLIEKHRLNVAGIDWFLPHYSSEFFRPQLEEWLTRIDFAIPAERWFTNLTDKGNTGSASIYIILEELFHSGRLKRGEKLLCFVPESGRFSMCYMLLTVV